MLHTLAVLVNLVSIVITMKYCNNPHLVIIKMPCQGPAKFRRTCTGTVFANNLRISSIRRIKPFTENLLFDLDLHMLVMSEVYLLQRRLTSSCVQFSLSLGEKTSNSHQLASFPSLAPLRHAALPPRLAWKSEALALPHPS